MSPIKKMPLSVFENEVLERLDVILKVLALQIGEGQSLTDRVRLLKFAGLDNRTMAQVLNTSPDVVRALASNLKARQKPKR